MLSKILASALALSGAGAQDQGPQQTTVVLQMKTDYTDLLTCEFNSNALPAGGQCYAVPSLGKCPGDPKTIGVCNAVKGCQWSPNMMACKVQYSRTNRPPLCEVTNAMSRCEGGPAQERGP